MPISPRTPRYTFVLTCAIATAVVVVAVVAVLVSPADLGPYVYFMPGPLGRQQVPLGLSKPEDQTNSGSDGLDPAPSPDLPLSALRHPPSVLGSPSSALRPPSSALRPPSSALRPPPSAVRPPSGYLTRSIGLRAGEEAEWGRHNGVTPALSFSHHLSTVFPRQLYATHPEFFPLVNGRRFDPPLGYEYWNPDLGRDDVARFAAYQASAYFRQNPDAVSYSLGVNDGLLFGESPEMMALLRASRAAGAQSNSPSVERLSGSTGRQFDRSTETSYFRQRPDYSPLVFTFMNRAAAELAKTDPDKYLGCLAYYWCENAPPFPVDPHVIPFLTADRSQSYDPAFRREELLLQRRWAEVLRARKADTLTTEKLESDPKKTRSSEQPDGQSSDFSLSAFQRFSVSANSRRDAIAPRIGLYDYLDGRGFLVPRVPIHAFAEHIRHAHAVGFTDYYGESSRNWGFDGPMPWVIAQLLQNPEQNVDALLDEYYTCYFQSAAGPMRQFFERCEQQWMRQSGPSYWLKYYRSQSQADLFPPALCRELRALLTQAAAAAAADDGRQTAEGRGRMAEDRGRTAEGGGLTSAVGRLPSVIRDRVAFVSDSFGVTERFVAFQNARTALTRATLEAGTTPDQLRSSLATYETARRDFIRYTHQVMAKWPLAFYPLNWDDWLRDDPAFAARSVLAAEKTDTLTTENLKSERGERSAEEALRASGTVDLSISRSVDPSIGTSGNSSTTALLDRSTAGPLDRSTDLPINGSLAGPLQPGRRIAGLQFGIDLPAPWQSRVEPTEHGVAEARNAPLSVTRYSLSGENSAAPLQGAPRPTNNEDRITNNGSSSPRFLHLEYQENTTVFQWVRAQPGARYVASVEARGRVSSGSNILLTIGFLDAQGRAIGLPRAMYLPEGAWPEFVTLRQMFPAPANAAWVGIGIRVQHQVGVDFGAFADFGLREIIADETLKR